MKPFAIYSQFTPIHNAILDCVMPAVSPPAFCVLAFIIRKTVGWGKSVDLIPLSQIRAGTSLKTDATVLRAVAELEKLGVLTVKRGARKSDGKKEPNGYGINLEWDVPDGLLQILKKAILLTSNFEESKETVLISNSKRGIVTVTNNKSRENFENFGDEMTTRLTLSDLRAFDPHPKVCGNWERSLCPLCNGGKSRDEAHQSFALDLKSFGFICHRCGAKGLLGRDTDYKPMPPRKERAKDDWREKWDKTRQMPLLGTPAEKYLISRALSAKLAAQSGVVFAGNFYGRAATCFPIRGGDESLVAVQGRYIDRGDLRMRTIGPKKLGVFATSGAWESDRLAVTEAPLDALSFAQTWEIPAIAICGSGLIPAWVLSRFRGELILASDNDDAGHSAATAWANQCGNRIATRRLIPTLKDWNADLMAA